MIFAKVDGEQAANLANFFDYGGILGGISCGILNDKTSECFDSPQNCIILTTILTTISCGILNSKTSE